MRSARLLLVAAAALVAGCESAPEYRPTPEPRKAPLVAEPVVLPGGGQRIPGASAPAPSNAQRDIVTVRMHVDGMTCPMVCVREVKAMLANVPGIVTIAVDSPTQTVQCEVVRGTDPQTLVAAIKSPYRARLM